MKIKTLNKTNKKKTIIGVLLCVFILLVLVISISRAKYKLTESISIATGTINYTLSDLQVSVIYLDGVETDTIPTSGYTFNESESYCLVDGAKDETVEFIYEDGTMYIGFTNKKTKCYLYFDKYENAPSINANESSYTITYGASNDILDTYFTVDGGDSTITTETCSSSIDGDVTNTSELSLGKHTITCSVTNESGLSSSASLNMTVQSTEKTTTITCSASSANCSTSQTLANLGSIVSVTSDKGSVTHSTNGTKLSLTFSGGSYTSREWVSDIVEYECCDTCGGECEGYVTEEYECTQTACPDGYTSWGSYGCCAGSTSNCVSWITVTTTCEKQVCTGYTEEYECNCGTCTRDDGYYKYTYTYTATVTYTTIG